MLWQGGCWLPTPPYSLLKTAAYSLAPSQLISLGALPLAALLRFLATQTKCICMSRLCLILIRFLLPCFNRVGVSL